MAALRLSRTGLTSNALILLVAAFLTAFGNGALIANVLKTYPPTPANAWPLLSLIFVFGGVTVTLLAVACFKRSTKPVLILILLLSSLTAYFMDSYGVVIDEQMLQNAALSHRAEVRDLVNFRLLAYVALLGVVPAIAVYKIPVRWRGWPAELLARLKLLGIVLPVMVTLMMVFGSFYASFIREHKKLRFYANPTAYVYSVIRYGGRLLAAPSNGVLAAVGIGSRIPVWDTDRELVILVIGETARADRFSLNGYKRETNPLLTKTDVISFTNFWACGTSTAASLPCMFSVYGEAAAGSHKEAGSENLLDVLQRSGVNVLWLDNNSDSKGVALRVPYENYRLPKVNRVCDIECRDEGMIAAIQPFIDSHPKGDIFIVMHQIGNHGPAYYLRYPPEFEKFTPTCKTNELNRCSREEINNAYDNAILYTDYFLSKVIEVLGRNGENFEAALFYVSDHGESLGEADIYLHGFPKMLAPKEQLHVPALMWFARSYHDVDVSKVRAKRKDRFTHDNVFHTVLGLLEIESSVYRPRLDILDGARIPEEKELARRDARVAR
jgi:lipid A ethanolaminephosphotransferase